MKKIRRFVRQFPVTENSRGCESEITADEHRCRNPDTAIIKELQAAAHDSRSFSTETRSGRRRKRSGSGNPSRSPFPKIPGAVKVKSAAGIAAINEPRARPFIIFSPRNLFFAKMQATSRVFPSGKIHDRTRKSVATQLSLSPK